MLYLYGPPASGKTTLARALALEWGRMYVDLDEEIVRRAGKSIPEIFAECGEAGFRRIESETLRSVDAPIVSLGGGTLLDPANREYAESRGMVVVLDVDAETVARRIAAAGGTRPLGDMLEKRRAHYASFAHHAGPDAKILLPRPLRGRITPPPSKSHQHRLLIAEFLAASPDSDVGESGSTLRFFAPLAAALARRARFVRRGRLAERPFVEYESIQPGVHELRGDVSSQFATGLLFALPILDGDSRIRFTTPGRTRRSSCRVRCAGASPLRLPSRTSTGFSLRSSSRRRRTPRCGVLACRERTWQRDTGLRARRRLASARQGRARVDREDTEGGRGRRAGGDD